jgi:hypothetical protein
MFRLLAEVKIWGGRDEGKEKGTYEGKGNV